MHGGHAVHQAVRAFVERRGACTLAAGPLPSNVLDVLKLAARASDKLDQWSLDLNIPSQRLTEIAGSFIEQVLITPEASHYRVLGVEPDASEARITVHYNWLMQWLRVADHASDLHAELALRIKMAYRDLTDPERRAAYDLAMNEALAARAAQAIQPAQYDPRRTPAPEAHAARPRRAERPQQVEPAARPEAPSPPPVGDERWQAETVLLDPAELDLASDEPPPLPSGVKVESRPDAVIALLTRPAMTDTQPPVRSRLPLALLALALLTVATLYLAREQWLSWLEGPFPQSEPGPAAVEVERAAPAPATREATVTLADVSPPPTPDLAAASAGIPPGPGGPVAAEVESSPAPSGDKPAELMIVEAAAAEGANESPPEPAVERVAVLPTSPAVPAEAREAARRVADAYASGDVQAVLSLVNPDANLTQPEIMAMAEEVKRWWFMQPGEPLSITNTRLLPPIVPDDGERAAVELRTSDDAGLRVIVARTGATWRARDVLVIAPTASRSGGSR